MVKQIQVRDRYTKKLKDFYLYSGGISTEYKEYNIDENLLKRAENWISLYMKHSKHFGLNCSYATKGRIENASKNLENPYMQNGAVIEAFMNLGYEVFLDEKNYHIPNAVFKYKRVNKSYKDDFF